MFEHTDGTIIRKYGDFSRSLTVPGEIIDGDASRRNTKWNPFHLRFRVRRNLSTPTVDDIDLGTISDRQVHKRIAIELPEFDRTSSRCDGEAERFRLKAAGGAVKNQYFRTLRSAYAYRDVKLTISRSEFTCCQCGYATRQ